MHPISWGHQHCTLPLTGTDGLVGNSEYEHFTTEINLDHSISHEAVGRVGDQQKFEDPYLPGKR